MHPLPCYPLSQLDASIPANERDAVSWLQRHAHSMHWKLPEYLEEGRVGDAHDPTFTVRVNVGPISTAATGTNKKLAKQNAARKAMGVAKEDSTTMPELKTVNLKSHSQKLHELVQRQGWGLEYPWAQHSNFDFVCAAVINGKVVSEERGATRRAARENASERATQTLRMEPTHQPFAQEVVKMAMAQFAALTEYIRVASSSCVACFVMESRDGLRVVAMGSGTGYYSECLCPSDDDREMVIDSHAEVLARRSLLRFLYSEIEAVQAQRRSIFEPAAGRGTYSLRSDVFFHLYISVLPCGDAKMFSVSDSEFLRPLQGIHCHNGCGHPLPAFHDINGHWPSMGRRCEGLLRARLNTGESYSPLPPARNPQAGSGNGSIGSGGGSSTPSPPPGAPPQRVGAAASPTLLSAGGAAGGLGGVETPGPAPGKRDELLVEDLELATAATNVRIRKVSCSDKILAWNVLGVQGAFLASLLTAPIYLRSVIIGGKSFSHGALSRALCCRAASLSGALRFPYRLNHPMLFHVGDLEISGQQEPAGHGGHKMSAVAWSWSSGDPDPEVLDCRNGRPIHALASGLEPLAMPLPRPEAAAPGAPAAPAAPAAAPDAPALAPAAPEAPEDEAEALAPGGFSVAVAAGAAARSEHNAQDADKPAPAALDAVSELNHCIQMNAWPVAIYTDTTPPEAPRPIASANGSYGRPASAVGLALSLGHAAQAPAPPSVDFVSGGAPPGGWQPQSLLAGIAPSALALGGGNGSGGSAHSGGGGGDSSSAGLQSAKRIGASPTSMGAPLLGPAHASSSDGAGDGVGNGGALGDLQLYGGGSAHGDAPPPTIEGAMSDGDAGEPPAGMPLAQVAGGEPFSARKCRNSDLAPLGTEQPGLFAGLSASAVSWSPGPVALTALAAPGVPGVPVAPGALAFGATGFAAAPVGPTAAAEQTPAEPEEVVAAKKPAELAASAGASRVFMVTVTCLVRGKLRGAKGSGSSKKRAKQEAARRMLDQLTGLLGPVEARPTSLVSGAELLARFKAIRARAAEDESAHHAHGGGAGSDGGGGGGDGGERAWLYGPSACGNPGPSEGNGGTAAAVTAGAASSGGTALEGLSYQRIKSNSAGEYMAVKRELHRFFSSPRIAKGLGGMGQRWLSRRREPIEGHFSDAATAAAAATVAAAAATAASTAAAAQHAASIASAAVAGASVAAPATQGAAPALSCAPVHSVAAAAAAAAGCGGGYGGCSASGGAGAAGPSFDEDFPAMPSAATRKFK